MITDIKTQVKDIAEKHGVDPEVATAIAEKYYDDFMYRPYGGATSYSEIDKNAKTAEYEAHMMDESYKFQALVGNIMCSPEMDSVDTKANAVKAAADEFKTRVSSYSMDDDEDDEKKKKPMWSKIVSALTGNDKIIKKVGDKWVLYSHEGKRLGTFDSREAAVKRERQINYFKHEGKEKQVSSGFKVFLDANGSFRWVSTSSNAFEDSDKELFTTKALDEAIEHADKSGERGPLLVYHVPSAEIGQCDYQGMAGRFLIESGTFDDTPAGHKALDYYIDSDEEHQVSIGFEYHSGDELDGQYDWLRIKERSVCPPGMAANPWTSFKVIGESPVNELKSAELIKIFGKDMAEEMITNAETKTRELEATGVRFKEKTEEAAPELTAADITTMTAALEGLEDADLKAKFQKALKSVAVKEEEAPAATSETPSNETVVATIPLTDEQMRGLAGLITDLTAKVESLGEMGKALESLQNEVKELKKTEDEKVAETIAPRWQFRVGDRPSQSDSNVISQDGSDLTKALKEAAEEANVNPAQKYVDDILRGQIVRS